MAGQKTDTAALGLNDSGKCWGCDFMAESSVIAYLGNEEFPHVAFRKMCGDCRDWIAIHLLERAIE